MVLIVEKELYGGIDLGKGAEKKRKRKTSAV